MKMEVNDKLFDVEIIRKNNKNTYIRIKGGKVVITTNHFVTKNSIKKLIEDNKDSILKMLSKDEIKKEKNSNFYFWGKKYDVVYGNMFLDLEIRDNKIFVLNDKMLNKYLNKQIFQIFSNHLNYWYEKIEENIPIPNLKIRKMTSRWGVCNVRNKNVTLNFQLYKYNIECLDYVIVHELCHFIHPNHSKQFWLLVNKYCPNYKLIRNKLKE